MAVIENPYSARGGYNGPAYVERDANSLLVSQIERGLWSKVLAARQSGKSSMISRALKTLDARFVTSVVDFGKFGPAKHNYDRFLARFVHDCAESITDSFQWNGDVDYLDQALYRLLDITPLRWVIFIDEIDQIKDKPYRDYFFSAIRAFWNDRVLKTHLPAKRLQFVLAGACLVKDIISNPQHSPFNVSATVTFDELDLVGLINLTCCLPVSFRQKELLAARIQRWTNGVVLLSHLLCERLWEQLVEGALPSSSLVDQIAEKLVERAWEIDHFTYIRELVAASATGLKALRAEVTEGLTPNEDDAEFLVMAGVRSRNQRNMRGAFRCYFYERVFGYRGSFPLVEDQRRPTSDSGVMVNFASRVLSDRIDALLKPLYEHSRHLESLLEQANVSQLALKKYLDGSTVLRLGKVGAILKGLASLYKAEPSVFHGVHPSLLNVSEVAEGLLTKEYTDLGVSGAKELAFALEGVPRIDFRPISEEIIDRYESSSLFTKGLYIPLEVVSLTSKDSVASADVVLLEVFASEMPVFFLLGDAGTGKTTSMKHLEYLLAQDYRKDPEGSRFPIYIDLRKYVEAASIEWLLLAYFSDLEIAVTAHEIRTLVENGRIYLLLDGFDKMAERLTSVDIEENLEQIGTWCHANGKLLLSSRTHLYKSDREIVEAYERILPKESQAENGAPLVLRPFRDEDWTTYIAQLFGSRAEEYKTQFLSIGLDARLKSHPLLLQMSTEILPGLAEMEIANFRRSNLYEHYINSWLRRDEWRSSLTVEERWLLAEEVAWLLFKSKSQYISTRRLDRFTQSLFHEVRYGHLDALFNEVRTASFFRRVGDGDYMFFSPVFGFYFLASALHGRIADGMLQDFGREKIHTEVVEILAEMKPDQNTLLDWANQSMETTLRDAGPHFRHNVQAILNKSNPISTELIPKLQFVNRKIDFALDPILAYIANKTLPLLTEPIHTVDIFKCYVEGQFSQHPVDENSLDGTLPLVLLEEFAWYLHLHKLTDAPVGVLKRDICDFASSTVSHWQQLLLRYDFLVQNDDRLLFKHVYLRDYFLACAILRRLSANNISQVGNTLWSERVLELLGEMNPNVSRLSMWIQITRKPEWEPSETGMYLASNAASLIHLLGQSFDEIMLDHAMLPQAVLPRVNLRGRSLDGMDLNGANLTHANLKETILTGVNLARAELRNAILTGADLTDADLTGADLTGAYLGRANLTRANLTDAKTDRITLTGATMDQAIMPNPLTKRDA